MSGEVARYYDANTARFRLVDRGRSVHSMHRELWAPGVTTSAGAADHINRILADAIADLVPGSAPAVFDFGCGVGGTLFHLARRFPEARLTGVTVSGRQLEIAERLARRLGLADRCAFRQGDFQDIDLDESADALVAVEAFAHSAAPEAFLTSAARHLRPGGLLLIADDFLAREVEAMDRRQRAIVGRFSAGWRVPSVCTVDRLLSAASDAGLEPVRTADLSALTRPGSRVRDRLVAAVSPLLAWLRLERVPFYGNVIGGNALQIGLREGFLRYQLVALRRIA